MQLADILIIDDHPDTLEVLSVALRRQNYRTRVVRSGRHALSAIRASNPDLIILDILMPNMDGFDVCRRLKASPATADIPIIFISALDDNSSRVKALELGGIDYVTKPIRIDEVIARIDNQVKISLLRKELAQKNRELVAANEKLQMIDRMKANFTAMLVHDLKSPLSVLRATMEVFACTPLIGSAIHDAGYDELLVASGRSLDKMLDLIKEVLELFRSEAGSGNLHLSDIEPNAFLSDCFQSARFSADRAGIHLEWAVPADLPVLRADAGKIERVFSNLLSNAIKFTPPGGRITCTASVETDLEGRWVVVSIEDTGEGIAADNLAALFEPYRQEASSKEHLGVGLGLAIAKRIVAAHGGDIAVSSTKGSGSRFIVRLPAAA